MLLLQSDHRGRKHWVWVLHIDGVLWFSRKSLPRQWTTWPPRCFTSQFTTLVLFLLSLPSVSRDTIQKKSNNLTVGMAAIPLKQNRYRKNKCANKNKVKQLCHYQHCVGPPVLQACLVIGKHLMGENTDAPPAPSTL